MKDEIGYTVWSETDMDKNPLSLRGLILGWALIAFILAVITVAVRY